MEKVLVDGKEVDVGIEIANGKVEFSAVYGGAGGGAEFKAYVSSDYLLDKLAAKIPGTFDDALIAIAKEALKKI